MMQLKAKRRSIATLLLLLQPAVAALHLALVALRWMDEKQPPEGIHTAFA
jgi:hypothetical protein